MVNMLDKEMIKVFTNVRPIFPNKELITYAKTALDSGSTPLVVPEEIIGMLKYIVTKGLECSAEYKQTFLQAITFLDQTYDTNFLNVLKFCRDSGLVK